MHVYTFVCIYINYILCVYTYICAIFMRCRCRWLQKFLYVYVCKRPSIYKWVAYRISINKHVYVWMQTYVWMICMPNVLLVMQAYKHVQTWTMYIHVYGPRTTTKRAEQQIKRSFVACRCMNKHIHTGTHTHAYIRADHTYIQTDRSYIHTYIHTYHTWIHT